jgi:hypothetical protein
MSLSERERKIRQRLKSDFEHYAAKCLKIRTKAGAIEPFILNRGQRYLHERLEEQRRQTGKVRALVLKGRQIGISTYIGGRFYWRTTHGKGLRAFILTHLDVASENLFGMAKTFHDNCPDIVRPATGKANAKELSFSKLASGYKVATAGSAEVGRSETLQLFHGSEVAFWANAEKHSAGVEQAIANADGTEDIRESTANGIGNAFYKAWKAAERGESEYIAVFIPWYWHEEYATEPPPGWVAPMAWSEYAALYGLTPAQTYWAWNKNRSMAVQAGGTAEEPCWSFRQEYPANAEEAFQSSSEQSFISALSVMKARKRTGIRPYGPIIVGVDPARGGKDKTGLLDRQGRVMGRHICKRVNFGEDTMPIVGEIVRLYRDLTTRGESVFICVDTTGLGGPIYDRLKEILPRGHVFAVTFSSKAWNPERYANRRAEIWDLQREWFEDEAGVQIPDSDELQGDLCAPVRGKGATHHNSNGQLVIESKEHIDERLKFSPDLGDAGALTFGVDVGALIEHKDDDEDSDDVISRYTRSSVTGY